MGKRTWEHKTFPWDAKMFPVEGVGGLTPSDFWRNRADQLRNEQPTTEWVEAEDAPTIMDVIMGRADG